VSGPAGTTDAAAPDAAPAPRRRKRGMTALVVAGSVLVVFAVLSAVLASRLGESAEYTPPLLSRPVPALTLPNLDGGNVDLAGYDGKVVIVNFFNSWCIPCKEEEPSLIAFHREHADEDDFVMVGIIRDDTVGAVKRWREGRDIGWTLVDDPDGRAAVEFATTGQPETYAVNPDGVIVARHLGRATTRDLERMLAAARGEAVS